MRYLRLIASEGHIRLPGILAVILCLSICSTGCESMGKKFSRKPKEPKKTEEMVLLPEEYVQETQDKEALYKQYFFFWKSWQDELVSELAENTNRKKAIECVSEVIKNLENLRALLNEEMQAEFDGPIKGMISLKEDIIKDVYLAEASGHIRTAEHLRREISDGFSFVRIKDYLK